MPILESALRRWVFGLSNTTIAVTWEQFGYLITEAVVIEQPQLTNNQWWEPGVLFTVRTPDQGSSRR
jgi:hypothetical protein